MTAKAREVLNDCRAALSLLEADTDAQRWRIHWAAAITLIRAVGHVLEKVDGVDPHIKSVARAAFKRWKGAEPEHEIFREFIERERNNLLKEYRSDVYPLSAVELAVEVRVQSSDGSAPVTSAHLARLPENTYRPLMGGPWEGDDARDVLSDAIAWWDSQLASIEREVAAASETSQQGQVAD